MAKTTRLQEIFDRVRDHLMSQGKPSEVRFERDGEKLVEGRYRGPNGLKCPAGLLIPDDRYEPEWEGRSAWTLDYFRENFSVRELALIDKLQYVHDFMPVDDWAFELQGVAHEFDINP